MESTTVVVDKQRRIYLPRRFREKIGSKFYVLKLGAEIRLVPVSKDPAKDLESIGSKLPRRSIKQLKKEILAEAQKGF